MKHPVFYLLLIFLSVKFLGQNTMSYTIAERDYLHGIELYQKKKFAASIRFFEKYLANNPEDELAVDARFYISSCYMYLGNENSDKYLGQFVKDNPGHAKSTMAYFQAGMFFYNKGDSKKTIENLEKVSLEQLDSDEKADALFALAYSYLLEKEYEKSREKFEKVEYMGSDYKYASSYYLGYIYFKIKAYDKSITALERASKNDIYASVVPFIIINIYYHQQNFDEVVKRGTQIIKTKQKVDSRNEIILLTGVSFYEKGDYKSALKYLKPYAAKRKVSSATEYRLAFAAFSLKDFELAEKCFKKNAGVSDSLGQASAYYLGHTYLSLGNRLFAYNAFLMSSNEEFDKEVQAEAIFNLAKLDYEAERFSEAIQKVNRLKSEFKEYEFPTPPHEIMTEAYLNSNNLDEAISYIEQIKYPNKRINEIYKEVTYLKGVSLFNQKKYAEAVQYFSKSLKTTGEPKYVFGARFWRAECYSIAHNWLKARNDYAAVFSAGEKSPYYRKARYGIAYTYFNEKLNLKGVSDKEQEKAIIKKYTKCLEHYDYYINSVTSATKDKYLGDALLRSADCNYQLKKYEIAIDRFNQAIKKGGQFAAYAYYQKGVIQSILSEYNQATESFDIVIKRYPKSVYVEEAVYKKAFNYYEVGQYQRAITYFTDYLKLYSATPRAKSVILERGVSYTNIKQYNKALEDFDEVLYNYCTDTVYSFTALKGCQTALSKLNRGAEYDTRLEQYFKCGGKGKERLTYEAAREHYRNDKFELAITKLEQFLVEYPESVFTYEVDYFLGMAYYKLKDAKMAKRYLYIVAGADQKYHYQEALIVLAGIYQEEKNWGKSNEINQKLLAITLSEQKKQIILLELIVGNYKTQEYVKCLGFVNEVYGMEGTLIYAFNKASLYKGLSLNQQGKVEEALDEFVLLSNNAKDVYAAQAHFMIAQIQYDQQKYRASLETLKSLLKTRSDFTKWHGEGYVLASMCYIKIGQVFQGKSFLKNVIKNHPDATVVKHAKEYLDKVEQQEAKDIEEADLLDASPNDSENLEGSEEIDVADDEVQESEEGDVEVDQETEDVEEKSDNSQDTEEIQVEEK